MDILDNMKKRGKRGDNWQAKFLKAFAEYGNLQFAADAANVSRQTVYNYLRDDSTFREKHDEAYARFCGSIEHRIRTRAFAGSDMLLIAMANRHMPAEYRQRPEQQQTITHDYIIEIGTPRAITTSNADTAQDVTPQRVHDTTGNVLE